MNAVMVDLETMGSKGTSAIVSIGAFKFDLNTVQELVHIAPEQTFYANVNLKSCIKAGLTIDADTVLWWMRQSDAARMQLVDSQMHLDTALESFTTWFEQGGVKSKTLWGNGATFDNVILRNAFDALHMPAPWHYTKDMCYRTQKNLFGKEVLFERVGVYHNALDDAIGQALHLQRIMHHLRCIGPKELL